MSSSPSMDAMAPLSRLTARCMTLLIEDKPEAGMSAAAEVITALQGIASSVEADWGVGILAGISEDNIGTTC
jgi:hypothetical protein